MAIATKLNPLLKAFMEAQTATHVRENPRMTLMFCAFEGEARILHVYGQAQCFHPRDPERNILLQHFPTMAGSRQIFLRDIDLVQTSCGSGVPVMHIVEQRGLNELERTCACKLPTLICEIMTDEICTICGRRLDIEGDELSGNCGGDCWGCIGEIEADAGWEPSIKFVIDEWRQGMRPNWTPPKAITRLSETVILWLPLGEAELKQIEASGWRAFPSRLPDQPFFYPVTNEAYAVQIARDWNAPRGGGWVTRFGVQRSFLEAYEVKQGASRQHLEYWIPAGDLAAFNEAIIGRIEVTAEFR